jgi:hypothetical protein
MTTSHLRKGEINESKKHQAQNANKTNVQSGERHVAANN